MKKLGSAIKSAFMTASKSVNETPLTIRFSTNHGAWVEVDPKNLDRVIRNLPLPSFLSDVEFKLHDVWENVGCGSRVRGKAGVAVGIFSVDRPKKMPKTGLDNLSFDADGFTCQSAGHLTKARYLMLETARFAKVVV